MYSTFDVLISKFDAGGNEEWYKRLGGSNYDDAQNFGYESPNGDLNIMCQTSSTDGDIKKSDGGIDGWLIKLGRCGEEEKDDVIEDATSDKAISLEKSKVLLSTYPNPVSNAATISFSLPQSQKVSIQVYDGAGRLVKTIADVQMETGTHQLTWDAADETGSRVATGMYYLKFNAGNYSETKKISVIK